MPHGNSGDARRRMKRFLLGLHGPKLACVHCGLALNEDTLTIDRIIPGSEGGRYARGNVQPSCEPCNADRGSRPMQVTP